MTLRQAQDERGGNVQKGIILVRPLFLALSPPASFDRLRMSGEGMEKGIITIIIVQMFLAGKEILTENSFNPSTSSG
jgi:hypothetical protein